MSEVPDGLHWGVLRPLVYLPKSEICDSHDYVRDPKGRILAWPCPTRAAQYAAGQDRPCKVDVIRTDLPRFLDRVPGP